MNVIQPLYASWLLYLQQAWHTCQVDCLSSCELHLWWAYVVLFMTGACHVAMCTCHVQLFNQLAASEAPPGLHATGVCLFWMAQL